MDTIFIKNLETFGILGIHAHEQRKPQRIRISARLSVSIIEASKNDDILQTVNYSTLAKQIVDHIQNNQYYTIEALIESLAAEILLDERIISLWLRIEKPDAVPDADSVGVEIVRPA